MKYYRGGKNDNTDFTALEFVFFLLKNLSNKHIAKAKIIARTVMCFILQNRLQKEEHP